MFDADAFKRDAYAEIGEPVTPLSGDPFFALFKAADVDPLGPPSIAGDYQLRYAIESAALAVGDLLTIRGQQYRVADDPYRIGDGREATVRLREAG